MNAELRAKRAYEALQARIYPSGPPFELLPLRTQQAWIEMIEAVLADTLDLAEVAGKCQCASCRAANEKHKQRVSQHLRQRAQSANPPIISAKDFCTCEPCVALRRLRERRGKVMSAGGDS